MPQTISGDEISVYRYDPETKQHYPLLKSPCFFTYKNARQICSSIKSRLICSSDVKTMIRKPFLPQGRNANREILWNVSRRLGEQVRRKEPGMWADRSWALHHNNALSVSSVLVRECFVFTKTIVVPRPPYSLDIAPCYPFSLSEMTVELRRWRFDTVKVQGVSEEALKEFMGNGF